MKIVLATPLYPPDIGGPATYAAALVQGLPSRGIEVHLVKFSDVRNLPKIVRHAAYFWRIVRAARKADLIFVQDTISCGVPAALAAFFTSKPLAVRVPGDYAWEQGRERWGVQETLDAFQSITPPWQVRLLQRLQSWVVRRAEKVIVPSNYFAKIVSKWGVAQDHLRVIYHGMELPSAQRSAQSSKGNYMVSAGRLVPWKGFEFLIKLLPDLPSWHLDIVGDGPERRRLEEAARAHNVAERVTFTGSLSREDLLARVSSADAFVLATTFESFSFQILEAMALSAAIVTTDVGSLPELITNGTEGVLLSPEDREGFVRAIESVVSDKALWNERKAAAREKAKIFSLENMLDTTAKLIQEI